MPAISAVCFNKVKDPACQGLLLSPYLVRQRPPFEGAAMSPCGHGPSNGLIDEPREGRQRVARRRQLCDIVTEEVDQINHLRNESSVGLDHATRGYI